MTKKILTVLLALAMLAATACTQDNSSEPARDNSSSASDSSVLDSDSENSSSDADDSSDSSSENTTTTSETTTTTTTTSATTTTENSTTTTTTTQATTTTKNTTQATTQATQKPAQTTKATAKPVQTTKATTKSTTKATTRATTKATTKATAKATQPAVNNNTYVNSIIADINKMFPESQFNRTLYDKFERLCKGIPTNDDLYQIKEQLCNFAMRKYNGKKGTFTYWHGITPTPWQDTVTAAKPISIKIDRTLGENDAHQNNGADTALVYMSRRSAAENYKSISIFIKQCYRMVDMGVPALVKLYDNKSPSITYKHTIYIFISKGYLNSSTGTTEFYLWFCNGWDF